MAVKLKIPRLRSATRTVTKTTPVNYAGLLANEPTLQATLAQIKNTRRLNAGTLTGSYQQTLGRLGEIPDLASLPENLRASLANVLDPMHLAELQGIVQQGNQAGTTALARKAYDYQHGQAQGIAGLAARGALQSSDLGNLQNQNLRNYTLDQYDARQAALDSLNQAQSAYLSQQQDLAGQQGTAVAAAQQRIGDQINLGQIAPTTSTAQVTMTPFLNPSAPTQPYTRVSTAGQTSYEPKPTRIGYPHPVATKVKPRAAPYLAANALLP